MVAATIFGMIGGLAAVIGMLIYYVIGPYELF
jgi:hypothetical protein